jgi:hypothetical protein
VRFGPLVRLHALDHLRKRHDRNEITERIGILFQAIMEELQARSYAENPQSDLERELGRRQRERIRSKKPFG